MTELKLSA